MTELRLISFGYLHIEGQAPPVADRVVDVREQLADPASYQQVLAMLEVGEVDGRMERVQRIVLETPGADALLDELDEYTRSGGTLAIGCGQGHDRSVALVELLAVRARDAGRRVVVEHLHVGLPRIRDT